MAKSLADRIRKAGLIPYQVNIGTDTALRLILNNRGFESLADYRDAVKRKTCRPGVAVRLARYGIERNKEYVAKWKAAGGRLP